TQKDGEDTMAKPIEPNALTERVATMMERSSRLWANSLDRSVDSAGKRLKPDPLNAVPALSKVAQDYWDHPQKFFDAATAYWTDQMELWTRMTQAAMGHRAEPMIEPARGDRRFKDEAWDDNPFFNYLKQSYLLTGHWLQERLAEADGLTPQEKKKVALLARNFVDALSPSNFAATNPEVIRTTMDEDGENLSRGLENLLRDMDRGRGQLLIRQTDMDAFKVGENMAVTPGKVIYQNRLMQLLQYTPNTEKVHAIPLLIVPPWINKFYIMDLNEKKSLIAWLVAQGHTVFVVSWVNPRDEHRDATWETYMQEGVLEAVTQVLAETGQPKTHITGYCIGGTMLGTTLAWMAEEDDDRIASATFFTAQLDFSDAGELQAFVDDEVIDTVAQAAEDHGYLAAENMFGAFNSLRSNDLIWSFVVNNYLLGKENFPFDLLYWNSDSTCMPGRVHTFYLDTFYNKNLLSKGALEMGGHRLDPSTIKVPCYHVAAIEDHIAPPDSAYRAAKMIGSTKQRFVLAGSGHIAGVINHPDAGKYQFWTKTGLKDADLAGWKDGAKETPGSWWPDWDKWLAKMSKSRIPAREPGAVLGQIEDAPGSYVRDRSDAR
ncbi:MAG: class I poly(R)-hydroxyalkanoic acid synthase, partial [Pseudomonadota bacterium]